MPRVVRERERAPIIVARIHVPRLLSHHLLLLRPNTIDESPRDSFLTMDLLLEESAVDPFAAGFTRKANAGSSAPPAPACAAANEEVEPRERPDGRLEDAAPP